MTRWWLDTRDKPGLLFAFLDEFCDRAQLALLGQLDALRLTELPGAEPVADLPAGYFSSPDGVGVSVPVTAGNTIELKRRLNAPGVFEDDGALMEVRLLVDGKMALLAGDWFHRECVSTNAPTPEALLQQLVATGVLRSYRANTTEYGV